MHRGPAPCVEIAMRILRDVPQSNAERDRAVRGVSAGGLGVVAGRTPGAQRGAGSLPATSEHRTYAPSRPNRDGRSRHLIAGHLLAGVRDAAAMADARPLAKCDCAVTTGTHRAVAPATTEVPCDAEEEDEDADGNPQAEARVRDEADAR